MRAEPELEVGAMTSWIPMARIALQLAIWLGAMVGRVNVCPSDSVPHCYKVVLARGGEPGAVLTEFHQRDEGVHAPLDFA